MANARTLEERIGVDLAQGYCGDRIHALGAVGVAEAGMADAIYRLKYANDPKAHKEALKAVTRIVERLATRHHWRTQSHSIAYSDIAQAVLGWWLADVCPACTGLGKLKAADAPVLDEACRQCHGTGKRPYPWINSQCERWYTLTLISVQFAERRVRDALLTKLGRQLRNVLA